MTMRKRRALATDRDKVGDGAFVADRHHGLAVLQTVFQRLGPEQHRQRHRHRAQLEHRHVGDGRLEALRHDDGHPIAAPHPQGLEQAAHGVGAHLQFVVGNATGSEPAAAPWARIAVRSIASGRPAQRAQQTCDVEVLGHLPAKARVHACIVVPALTDTHCTVSYDGWKYQTKKAPRSEFIPIRNLKYHVLVWGNPGPGKVPLVMVHGWMDVAASYQFMVDAFSQDHYVIAPDWRGYGLTESAPTDNYWFPDYLADLDFLLDHYSPEAPVNLVGHSMGGNVAMLYSGSRPQRIRRLVNLEGFGMAATRPSQAPTRYARWMDELKALHRGELALKPYGSVAGVARRLMKTNKRLTQDKADWLAQHWASHDADGMWRSSATPPTRSPMRSSTAWMKCWKSTNRSRAPTLAVEAGDDSLSQWWQGKEHFGRVPRTTHAAERTHRRGRGCRPHAPPRPARTAGQAARGIPGG